MSHVDNLARSMGSLEGRRILDLGAGKGDLLIELAKRSLTAIGIEYNPEYIRIAQERAVHAGVTIDIRQGAAEALPLEDGSFDRANASEVIEHVQDPRLMLDELYRVLASGGLAYVSVPNRYGLKDPHFHLYAVNWLPRAWSDAFIRLCGKAKDYDDEQAGAQRLREMHYYTYRSISREAARYGFRVQDIRQLRITTEYRGLRKSAGRIAYALLRPWYFDSFHLLLTKP